MYIRLWVNPLTVIHERHKVGIIACGTSIEKAEIKSFCLNPFFIGASTSRCLLSDHSGGSVRQETF